MVDILRLLGMKSNPNKVISDYGLIDPKHVQKQHGGNPRVNYLTERGLQEVLFRSNSKLAEAFKDFVYELLHRLRTKQLAIVNARIRQLEEEKHTLTTRFLAHTKVGSIYRIYSDCDQVLYRQYDATIEQTS
jgi:prophage antirepressor-like protein